MSAELARADQPQIDPRSIQIAVSDKGVQLRSFDEMSRFCLAVSQSGLAPKDLKTPQAIMVAMQYGMELGLSPMQAIQSVAVINGKPTIYGDGLLAVCQQHPDFENIEEEMTPEGAVCTIRRRGRVPVRREFTWKDAKIANLMGKPGPWQQYPNRMLQMRARGFAARDAFADALRGFQVRGEVEDYQQPQEKPARAKLVLPGEEAAPVAEVVEQPKVQTENIDPATGEFTWE